MARSIVSTIVIIGILSMLITKYRILCFRG